MFCVFGVTGGLKSVCVTSKINQTGDIFHCVSPAVNGGIEKLMRNKRNAPNEEGGKLPNVKKYHKPTASNEVIKASVPSRLSISQYIFVIFYCATQLIFERCGKLDTLSRAPPTFIGTSLLNRRT